MTKAEAIKARLVTMLAQDTVEAVVDELLEQLGTLRYRTARRLSADVVEPVAKEVAALAHLLVSVVNDLPTTRPEPETVPKAPSDDAEQEMPL